MLVIRPIKNFRVSVLILEPNFLPAPANNCRGSCSGFSCFVVFRIGSLKKIFFFLSRQNKFTGFVLSVVYLYFAFWLQHVFSVAGRLVFFLGIEA